MPGYSAEDEIKNWECRSELVLSRRICPFVLSPVLGDKGGNDVF